MREVYNQTHSISKQSYKKWSSISLHPPPSFKQVGSTPSPQTSSQLLRVHRDHINKTVEIYSWRSKTSLPILRVENYSVSPIVPPCYPQTVFSFDASTNNNPHKWQEISKESQLLIKYIDQNPAVSFYQISTKIEDIHCRLIDINHLSFPQIVYLLKEMLIGFEVLIDIFGIFEPNEKMITVNLNLQWKIWPNQDFRINEVKTQNISFKEFITKLIFIAERYSQVTNHSKAFFNILNNYIKNQNPCTFIKTLEVINDYITFHKILQVKKVIMPNQKFVQMAQGRNLSPNSKKIGRTASYLTFYEFSGIKGAAQRRAQSPEHCSMARHDYYRQSRVRLQEKPGSSYVKLATQYPTYKTIKQQSFNSFTPNPWTSQQQIFCNSPNNAFNLRGEQKQYTNHFSTPNKKIAFKDQNSIATPSKTLSIQHRQLNGNKLSNKNICAAKLTRESPSKLSSSKYSEKSPEKLKFCSFSANSQFNSLLKIKSANKLPNLYEKASTSSIYFQEHSKLGLKDKKYSQNCISYEPIFIKAPEDENQKNVQGNAKCLSPHNSSSTKQLQNSAEMAPNDVHNYAKLKEIDLTSGKQRNNQSAINTHISISKANPLQNRKNLVLSHQFHHEAVQIPRVQGSKEQKNQWNSIITDLFNDTRSIKVLKESIKMKAREEVFEKDHLKDVKLELLGKFGRNANHIVLEDQPSKQKCIITAANYKSMQLIEEEIEEIKSVNETDRDLFRNKMHDKSQDEESGFNFETEMYVINPQRRKL